MHQKLFYPTPIPEQSPAPTLPRLGSWHTISATVEKSHDPESVLCTRWRRRECEPVQMMFIGTRIVREGEMVDTEKLYHDADGVAVDIDYGRAFQPRRFIHVWQFVKTAHTNPVFVLPSDAVEIKE